MRASHLLGENWEAYWWYDTPEQREQALAQMHGAPPWYRQGDQYRRIVEKVER